jgi:hypothetical protein
LQQYLDYAKQQKKPATPPSTSTSISTALSLAPPRALPAAAASKPENSLKPHILESKPGYVHLRIDIDTKNHAQGNGSGVQPQALSLLLSLPMASSA